MRNPFLILRFVFFAVLIYLNSLGIGFAAWNVIALKNVGSDALSPAVFVILNACALFLFLMVALAELVDPSARTAQVIFECGWTAVMSVFQLASAVNIAVNGPPDFCGVDGYLSACSSSTALVCITWVSSTLLLMYFLILFITALSHSSTYGGVWGTTVYTMPWFSDRFPPTISVTDAPKTLVLPQNPPPSSTLRVRSFKESEAMAASMPQEPYADLIYQPHHEDLEAQPSPLMPPYAPFTRGVDFHDSHTSLRQLVVAPPRMSSESSRPTWAKSVKARRGVDNPFSVQMPTPRRISRIFNTLSLWSPNTEAPPPVPVKPDLPQPAHLNGGFLGLNRLSYSHFPEEVENQDLPIDQNRLSSWVRADASAGYGARHGRSTDKRRYI